MSNPYRVLRDRTEGGRDLMGRIAPALPSSSAAQLVQIGNGGHMPTATNAIFLGYPAFLDGAETEGGSPAYHVDGTRTVPVLVIGSRVPVAGDFLVARAVGGRWVAESGGTPPGLPCWPCQIPRKTLTVSWTNSQLGNSSAPLVYRPPGLWSTGCVNQIIMALDCLGGIIQFAVTFFVSGSCPGGQSQSCQSPGYEPFGLTLADSTCSPFHLHYQIVGAECPLLSGSGYTDFFVDQ